MSSILLVEDHAAFGKALVRLLSEKGNLEVLDIISSGEKTLERLPNLNVDLLLIDEARLFRRTDCAGHDHGHHSRSAGTL